MDIGLLPALVSSGQVDSGATAFTLVHSVKSHREGLHLDQLFSTSGTWLTLREAVSPGQQGPAIKHQNTENKAWLIQVVQYAI